MYDNLRKVMDFDDLLFKSRNRDYGAYQLRKRYNSVLITGIIMASFLVTAAIVFPFILTPHSGHVLGRGGNYVQVRMETFEPPVEKIYVPPSPPPPEAARLEEIIKYVPPVVVDTVLPAETQQAATDQILSQSASDKLEVTGTGTGDDLLSGQDGSETNEPLFMVEVMPSFKGGDINKFREWVQKRTNYPQIAIDNKIQGRVFLTFIVETDGSVSNVTIVKGVDPIIDNEAVKAIQSSPKWSPGLQRGQPVRVRYSMSLFFAY
ncbi:MAG: energy transducer TonB [Bacteroidetes bacterium]|nr:MAG: energy transducer TonB [Bacteroidota bacterium]